MYWAQVPESLLLGQDVEKGVEPVVTTGTEDKYLPTVFCQAGVLVPVVTTGMEGGYLTTVPCQDGVLGADS